MLHKTICFAGIVGLVLAGWAESRSQAQVTLPSVTGAPKNNNVINNNRPVQIDGWDRARIEKELGRKLTAQDQANLLQPADIHFVYTDSKTGMKQIGYMMSNQANGQKPPQFIPVPVPVPQPIPVPQPGPIPVQGPNPLPMPPTTAKAPPPPVLKAPATPVRNPENSATEEGRAKAVDLVKLIADKDDEVRQTARKTLAEIGAPAVSALTGVLKNGNKEMRLAAAATLEMFGAEARGAILALNKALTDEDEEVRQAAQSALKAIDKKD